MTNIEQGDLVFVVMDGNDVFPWQIGPTFQATLIAAPEVAGEAYLLEVEGRRIHLNGNSSRFVGLWAIPDEALAEGESDAKS